MLCVCPRARVNSASTDVPGGATEEQRHEEDDSWTYVLSGLLGTPRTRGILALDEYISIDREVSRGW